MLKVSSDIAKTQILKGLSIYVSILVHIVRLSFSLYQINGWTKPSVQDLRQLIIRNGGIFQPYLDKKALVYVSSLCPSHLALTSLTQDSYSHLFPDTSQSTRIQTHEGCSTRMARR
jgi:hypothetical protein